MIEKPTVLILGAGASQPYGLPLGSQLRDSVLRAVDNVEFRSLHQESSGPEEELSEFALDLATSGFSSVDAFLEERPQWTGVGKLAMAWCLMGYEQATKATLFPPTQSHDHWYETLWATLKSRSWRSFKKQPLSIITFNYDRSLEHYLVTVACNNYSLRPQTAAAGLPIVHVHGTLGPYDASNYGGPFDGAILNEASKSIRVVHEADVEHSEFVRARQLISKTERVLFIGFRYLDTNMRKLGFPHEELAGVVEIAGTSRGIPHNAWRETCRTYGIAPNPAPGAHLADVIADTLY
jgi:hypothetical protein